MIKLENISKSYGKKKILSNISLDVPKGCIFGLLGPSGCGKTSLVKIIAGITRQDLGKAYILDKEMPNYKVLSDIGYMAQAAALYPTLSAYENLKFFGELYGIKKKELTNRIDTLLKMVDLTEHLNKPVSTFSGGMKQRLSLAISLISNPKVLILDEPTVGIDPVLRQNIWNELYNLSHKGVSILVTTHIMDEANKCNMLAMMRNGSILASGTPDEIIETSHCKTLEEAFIYYGKSKEIKGGN